MFDIVGKVVDVVTGQSSYGQDNWRWTEIVVRECNSDEDIIDESNANDIPVRFSANKLYNLRIVPNAWVKVRFSLSSRSYMRDGERRRALVAKGIMIKLLYEAKAEDDPSREENLPQGSIEIPF